MLLSILFFLLSIIPSVWIFLWLGNRRKEDLSYRKSCKDSFLRGLFAVLPILGISCLLFIANSFLRFTLLKNHVLIYKAIYTFIVLALAEEIVKYTMFRKVLQKTDVPYSWADVVAFMAIIGTAFGLIEDIPYAIGADPITMLVRGISMGHIGYGFLMGWFYGKKLYTGEKKYGVIAFGLPWLLHGLYDFSLTPELIKINDNFMFIGFCLALFDIILIVLLIRFFKKARKTERYQKPLVTPAEAKECVAPIRPDLSTNEDPNAPVCDDPDVSEVNK